MVSPVGLMGYYVALHITDTPNLYICLQKRDQRPPQDAFVQRGGGSVAFGSAVSGAELMSETGQSRRGCFACCKSDSVTLSSPRAADDELSTAASGSAEKSAAVGAGHGSLGVRENSVDLAAGWADDVHEE